MAFKGVRYSRNNVAHHEFITELKNRVNNYFNTKGISKYANFQMVLKTVAMFSMYLVPLSLILFGQFENVWIHLGLWAMMGVGMAGIGLSVMHDANHGSYSRYKWVNKLLGSSIYLLGGNPVNWRIQHNVLHHSFTNIDGLDEDISPVSLLRFSPHKPLRPLHKYQHWYAWPLYGLMTMMWVLTKDFKQILRYRKLKLTQTQGKSFAAHLADVITSKTIYYALILILPLIFAPIAWYWVISGFVLMHFIGGFILTCVFQPAHVVPFADFPLPDDKGSMENSFAIHELATTSNFAPNNRLLSWYVGGLNYQVEHHLFPDICHIHYRDISKIVSKTAKEYALPYYSLPTFSSALKAHWTMLRQLGQPAVASDMKLSDVA